MNQITNAQSTPLPSAWIERLWGRFASMYGNKFLDMWRGLNIEEVKNAWAEDLAGYSADELKRGLEWCKTQAWPPSLPEFMNACRPVLDAKTEWAEACEQMRIRLAGKGGDRWTRPQVYWAAVAIGAFDLNNTSWDQIAPRWKAALAVAKTDAIPEYRAALPAPGKNIVTREEAKDRMAEILDMVEGVAMVGTTKAGTKWAYRLMEREAEGESLEHIAATSWREVLGYPKDMSAKKALEHSQQEAA